MLCSFLLDVLQCFTLALIIPVSNWKLFTWLCGQAAVVANAFLSFVGRGSGAAAILCACCGGLIVCQGQTLTAAAASIALAARGNSPLSGFIRPKKTSWTLLPSFLRGEASRAAGNSGSQTDRT